MNSTGYNWATQDPAGIAAGGLDAYYANINKLLTDPSSNLSGAQAAMQQYGISPEDIQAATGRTLESFYPSAGALAQATGSTNPINVLALGDSTTWGWYGGNQVANNMVASAQNRLGSGYNLTNQGVNSTAISDLFGTPEYQNSLSSNADVVALNYGMNEAYRGVPIEDFRNNLLRAVDDFQKAGKKVILQTPNATSSTDPWAQNVSSYAQVVRDVANATGSTLQDKYAKTSGMEGATSSFDPIHPTEATYGLLGSDFADVIQGLYAPSTGAVVQTTTPATTASMDTQAQTGSVQAPTTSGTSGALDTVASQQVDTPSASAGYLWATQDPAGIAAGGLNNYYNNINRLVSDPSSTLASTQSAMSQYGISPEDVLAATGRSLESFYPSTGALSQTTLPSTTSATAGALTQASAPTQDVSATQGALSTVAPTTQQSVASTTTDAISTERENPFPAGSTISAWYESLPESGEGITKSLIGYEASRYGVGSVQNTYAKNPAFSEWASSYQTNLDVENARKGILSDDNPYETGTNASIVYASLPVDQKNILLSNPYAKTTFNALIESKGDEAGARAFLAREQKISDLASQIAGGAVEDQYWTGYGYGGKSQNSLAMATWLSQNGITDLGQLGVKAQQVTEPIHQIGTDAQGKPIYGKYNFYNLGGDTGSVSILEPVDDPSKVSIVNGQPVYVVGSRPAFYNKQTGRELGDIGYGGEYVHYVADEMLPSDFSQVVPGKVYQVGQTFAGEGGTAYNVVFDQQGKPNFFTSWTGSTSDAGAVAPLLAVASLVPGPIGIGAGLLNAGIALDQGNEAGAILSLLGAGTNYYGGQLTGMTTPGSPTAVSGLDLASDVATLGANPAVQIQNTLSNLNTAKTGVQIASALQNQDPSALITSLATTAAGQAVASQPIGDTGLTVGEVVKGTQVANLVNNGQFAQAATLAGDLVNSPDLKVAGLGASILQEAGKENPDFNKIIGYATQLDSAVKSAGEPKPAPKGDLGERVYDDTIVSAGAKAFEDAKRAGATDQEAMDAANAVTAPAKPAYDQGEFEGLGEAQAAAKAASTVAIGNAEADTPEEAMALARARNPNAMYFNYGGQEYTITASPGQMESITKDALRSEINDLPTFNEAYAAARKGLGPGEKFPWRGQEFVASSAEERPDLAAKPAQPIVNVDQSDAETARLINKNNELAAANAPDQSTAESARLAVKNKEIGLAKTQEQVNAAKAAINSVLGEGTASNIVIQGLSNIHQAAGQTLDFFGGTAAALGLAKPDNVITQSGQGLTGAGEALQLESVNRANQNVINAVKNAEGFGNKVYAGAKAILENPMSANMALVEVMQEALPIGVASKVFSLTGKMAAAVGVDVALNAIESGGANYNERLQQSLKEGKTLEQADRDATTAFYIASAVTAATGGIVDTALVNKITRKLDDAASVVATKPIGSGAVSAAKEAPTEAAEVFATGVLTSLALGQTPDINKILTQSIVEGYVGGKTSGAIDVTGTAADVIVGDTSAGQGQVIDTGLTGATTTPAIDTSSISSNVATSIESGADAASVIGGVITDSVSNGADPLPVIDSAVSSAIGAGADVSTVIGGAVSSAVNSGSNVDTSIASSINAAVNAGSDINTVVDAAKDAATSTGNDVEVSTDNNVVTIQNSTTNTNTTVDTNTGVTTVVNNNTGTTTQIQSNPATNSQTTTTVDSKTGINTKTTVDTANNTTTKVAVDTNTNVTTETTTDSVAKTETTVTTDPNTNTQTTTTVDTNTNTVIDTKVDVPPPGYRPPVIEVSEPKATPSTPSTTTTTTSTPGQAVQAPTSLQAYSGDAGLVGAGAMGLPSRFEIDPALLPSKQTQKAIDPIQRVIQAQAELEKTAMMQQIDPRLLNVLQQRAAPEQQVNQQQQFDRDIGALSQILSGQPQAPANEGNYYSYGSESSIDDILGGRAVGYKQGGYVAPLMAQGGMALPLLAKSGGALSHYEGRENFKDGKHVAGEGDGQSDDIPAWLADGEFVVPSDVVSALGNGSSKAGTDKLYEMMHSIRERARSTGPKDLPPPALKSPLDYMKKGNKK